MSLVNDNLMRIRRSVEKLFFFTYSLIAYLREPYEFIFIFGHMRSGSSLLAHLLISNPDICGFGETHTRYSKRYDFNILIGKVLYRLGRFPNPGRERYILDKVLHNYLFKAEDINLLCSKNSHVIFLLREPRRTLQSIMESVKFMDFSEGRAVHYYVTRLEMLDIYAQELTRYKPCLVITYDQIIDQTDKIFKLLEQFLDLQHPLTENYQVIPTTGKPGVGDPSQSILVGSIIRNTDREMGGPRISDKSLKKALRAFQQCYASLRQCCLSINIDEQN